MTSYGSHDSMIQNIMPAQPCNRAAIALARSNCQHQLKIPRIAEVIFSTHLLSGEAPWLRPERAQRLCTALWGERRPRSGRTATQGTTSVTDTKR